MYLNTTGVVNAAFGRETLANNTSGSFNTAFGTNALFGNTTASSNTAVGYQAGYANTTGSSNTVMGYQAMYEATAGERNTAIGVNTARGITTGNNNACLGHYSGFYLTTGVGNTLIGYACGYANGASNKLTTGSTNVLIGNAANVSASSDVNSICITTSGNGGKGTNTGFIYAGGGGVYQGNNSSTWSTTSDRRLKKNITDSTVGLAEINQLQVRNFEYRTADEITELDPMNVIEKSGVQVGVIAQEIQTVLPDCVKEESTGVLSVDPDNLTWHLVKAVQELTAKVEALEAQLNA